MSDDELLALAGAAVVVEFAAGATVADYTTPIPDDVWMVCEGRVDLQAGDGTPLDTVEVGGIFGYTPLLTGGGMDFVARTAVPSKLIRLPDAPVRAQFAKPAGLAYLASSAFPAAGSERAATAPIADAAPVADLVRGDVLVTTPDASVRETVVAMTDRHVSYALIRLRDGGIGIFTDRDLRTRVVAAGLSVDVPIASVMSAPARSVTVDMTAEAVLMDMLECGLRHMPVLTARGEVVGVLEDADLLAASARRSFLLRRGIGDAADAAELQRIGSGVRTLAAELFRNGTKASATSGIVSVVIDSLVRKALSVALIEHGVPAGFDTASREPSSGDAFAWLSLGSVARREAMPSSDVDSALSWRDGLDEQGVELRAVAARTHEILDACGLPSDSNGAVASSPLFARSRSQWAAAAEGWLDDPLRDRGLILSSLLIDGRVVWGAEDLNGVPGAYRRMRQDHPNALRLQLLNALSDRVRARSLRDVLSRRGGTFDLKNHAVTPLVNLARWGGLMAGVASATTPVRLGAAAGAGAITESDATTLCEVFAMVQRLRMAHQVEQLGAGHTPGDVITMSELSPLNRSLLNDGLREIAAVQRRIRNLSMLPPSGLR